MGTMILQGLHVLFGVLWFGGSIFSTFVVIPATSKIDATHANPFMAIYAKLAERYMTPVSTLAIIFGIILGFPLHAWSNIGHTYGNTYLIAFVVSLLVYWWGIFMIGRNIKKGLAHGFGTPEFRAITNRVKKYAGIELLGFFAIFVLMVLLSFDY
ncbi:hypothetical protein [Sulfobacillus thermosulfidooxidans]|uniref:hypothetical protein n=1 Tax=Sulfobacillus thermosulfidooxidans TaxID=28034 RepID=UPI0006B426AB|nr:hypothetical protein [Sulfobacillus thermosulfidooxidans]